jgi:hypothetical protein
LAISIGQHGNKCDNAQDVYQRTGECGDDTGVNKSFIAKHRIYNGETKVNKIASE